MKFTILSLFPEMFNGPLSESIIKRAKENGLLDIEIINFRDFATDKHKTVDDTPYGGGPGMLLKVDVIDRALNYIRSQIPNCHSCEGRNPVNVASTENDRPLDPRLRGDDTKKRLQNTRTILLTPQGERFTQRKAIELSKYNHLILICGHYEGFDERIREHSVDEELSIGDFVLTGGELPAMVVVDAVSRMIPGVIKEESALNESFMSPTQDFDYPQYTRPPDYNGWKVPEILLSGNHAEIKKWRESHRK